MPFNQLSQRTEDFISSYRAVVLRNCPISATGDVLINGQPGLPIPYSRYIVDKILVDNPLVNGVSGSVSAGLLGVFAQANAAGTAVAANQALTPTQTTGTTAAQALTLTAAQTTVRTEPVLYVNVGTGVAGATVDISVYVTPLLP